LVAPFLITFPRRHQAFIGGVKASIARDEDVIHAAVSSVLQ